MLDHKGPARSRTGTTHTPTSTTQKNCCAAAGVTLTVHAVGHKVKEAPAHSHWKNTTACILKQAAVAAPGALLPMHTSTDSQHKPQPSAAATAPTTPCFATAHMHSGKLPWKNPSNTGRTLPHTQLHNPAAAAVTELWDKQTPAAPEGGIHKTHGKPPAHLLKTLCVCGLAGNTCYAGNAAHTTRG